jgi:hypothetical protein
MNSADPYQGCHLIAELYGCAGLDDLGLVERALTDAAAGPVPRRITGCGRTALRNRLRPFQSRDYREAA